MAPTQGWRLQLWGAPGLMGPLGVAPRCEGKALALLVYLALEGPSTRARLADLLWPQTGAASRNNLVVLLRRMRQAYGEALWTVSGPLLTLGGQVEVVRGGAALLGDALPLAGWDTPELPEFSAWIAERRQSLRAEALQTLREQAQGLEARGAYAGSRTVLRRALDLEPFSEETARALMRAEYLSGDPAAALRTFSDLRLTLERDLNVVPTALTLALAEEIRQAARSGPGLPPARSGAVPTPLAAPQLIGRQAQWQAMSAAWTAGQAVVLTGEAGVGKSRLARDFAVAWEAGAPGESRPVTAFCGRPSDAPVPYAAVTRSLREVLARQPGLPIPAPTRRTLAALLPERFGAVPPPERDIGAALDTALREVFALALTEGSRLLLDDVHLMDAASARLLLTLAGTVGGPAMVACVRDAEVPAPSLLSSTSCTARDGRCASHLAHWTWRRAQRSCTAWAAPNSGPISAGPCSSPAGGPCSCWKRRATCSPRPGACPRRGLPRT